MKTTIHCLTLVAVTVVFTLFAVSPAMAQVLIDDNFNNRADGSQISSSSPSTIGLDVWNSNVPAGILAQAGAGPDGSTTMNALNQQGANAQTVTNLSFGDDGSQPQPLALEWDMYLSSDSPTSHNGSFGFTGDLDVSFSGGNTMYMDIDSGQCPECSTYLNTESNPDLFDRWVHWGLIIDRNNTDSSGGGPSDDSVTVMFDNGEGHSGTFTSTSTLNLSPSFNKSISMRADLRGTGGPNIDNVLLRRSLQFVPEPTTMFLLIQAVAVALFIRRRRR